VSPARACIAVLLAAGRGTRMQEASEVALTPEQAAAADVGLKFLVPVRGRPFLDWVLDEVAAAGFEEACLVVSPDSPLRRRDGDIHRGRLLLRAAIQAQPRGGANAVLAAEEVVAGRDLVVLNADNLYPADVLRRLLELDGPGLAGFDAEALVRDSNIPAVRVAAFALIRAEGGVMTGIVEKPTSEQVAAMAGAPVSMTCWRFQPEIFDACRDVAPSARGELELPDAVGLSMERGTRYQVVPVRAGVLDMSRREDIPAVERFLAARTGR
jgi:dTDP-glucose pyrophosphorylase